VSRGRAWIAGLAGLAGITVLSAVAAVVLLAIGSAMTAEADAYFSQYDFSQAVEIDETEFELYNGLYIRGSALTATTEPLLFCTVAGVVILLAVLAARRDAVGQTGAPAAS
jgi:hypothetical protein